MTFVQDPIRLQEFEPSKGKVSIQVDRLALLIVRDNEERLRIAPEQLQGWECSEGIAVLTLLPESGPELTLVLKGSKARIQALRELIHEWRLEIYIQGLTAEERRRLQLEECPACTLRLPMESQDECIVSYCPECHAMWNTDSLLTEAGGEPFNFCSDGYFTQIGKESRRELWQAALRGEYCYRSLDDEVRPTLQKIVGHGLWIFLWCVLLAFLWYPFVWQWSAWSYWSPTWMVRTVYGLMGMMALHIALLGYYSTGLVMTRSVSSFLRPHLWERFTRFCRFGFLEDAEDLMRKNALESHPGLLCNLAVALARQGDLPRAREFFEEARSLCPSSTVISRLACCVSLDSNNHAPN